MSTSQGHLAANTSLGVTYMTRNSPHSSFFWNACATFPLQYQRYAKLKQRWNSVVILTLWYLDVVVATTLCISCTTLRHHHSVVPTLCGCCLVMQKFPNFLSFLLLHFLNQFSAIAYKLPSGFRVMFFYCTCAIVLKL